MKDHKTSSSELGQPHSDPDCGCCCLGPELDDVGECGDYIPFENIEPESDRAFRGATLRACLKISTADRAEVSAVLFRETYLLFKDGFPPCELTSRAALNAVEGFASLKGLADDEIQATLWHAQELGANHLADLKA